MKIGIAGWIGSGKTLVSRYLAYRLGFTYLDVDSLGHRLLNDSAIQETVKMEFGLEVMSRDLKIDRKKLGEKVFSNPSLLERYNDIIHPVLRKELRKRLDEKQKGIVVDAALLDKFRIYDLLDKVILVEAEVGDIFERKKKQYTKEQLLNIINNQKLPSNPDFVIKNDGSVERLKSQIDRIAETIDKGGNKG
jgi:dephospho-CoA kinase